MDRDLWPLFPELVGRSVPICAGPGWRDRQTGDLFEQGVVKSVKLNTAGNYFAIVVEGATRTGLFTFAPTKSLDPTGDVHQVYFRPHLRRAYARHVHAQMIILRPVLASHLIRYLAAAI